MNLEALRQQTEIVREKTRAAKYISELRLSVISMGKEKEAAYLEMLSGMTEKQLAKLNLGLRKAIPKLYEDLLHAPVSSDLIEVEPLHSPNGYTYWRELYVKGLGRIDVHTVKGSEENSPAAAYQLQVGDLPIVEGQRRADAIVLTAFTGVTQRRVNDSLFADNMHLLDHHETLASVCVAAGLTQNVELGI